MDHGAVRCEDVGRIACAHLVPATVFRDKYGNYHQIVGRLCCKTLFVVYLILDTAVPDFAHIGMAVDGVLDRFGTGHGRDILRIILVYQVPG